MAALAGSVVWARAPRHLLLASTSSQLPPAIARPQAAIRFGSRSLRIRRNATSQDKTVSSTESSAQQDTDTQQKEEAEEEEEEEERKGDESSSESSSVAVAEQKPLDPSAELKAKEIGDALRELRGKKQEQNEFVAFWNGLLEEIGLIEWPDFGKVFGTTVVVLSIIIGSSIVLLTVNFLLAELSDLVFKVKTSQ